MSIHVMNRVWRESPAKGSELLLLLAIADFADDDGMAWPGVETLATKARLSKRQTQYNIRSLVDAGLLSVEENAGPKGTHRYHVNMAAAPKLETHSVCQGCGAVHGGNGPAHHRHHIIPRDNGGNDHPDNLLTLCESCHIAIHSDRKRDSYPLALLRDAESAPCKTCTMQPTARGGAKSDQKGVQPIAPEPSVEPSKNHQLASKQKPTPLPGNGPAQQIVKTYCDEVGIPKPANYAKTVGQAQHLADAGVRPEDIPAAVAWCRSQKWLDGSFDLGTILSQADKWRAAQRMTRVKRLVV
jgi:hypothetical protein